MTLRENSRKDVIPNSPDTFAAIDSGSLQRIADACEKMALNYDTLIRERELYKKWYREGQETNRHLRGTIAAMKAWQTRRAKQG